MVSHFRRRKNARALRRDLSRRGARLFSHAARFFRPLIGLPVPPRPLPGGLAFLPFEAISAFVETCRTVFVDYFVGLWYFILAKYLK